MGIYSKKKFVRSWDETRLYYERAGHGPSLLLCDGLLCQGHAWKYFVPALKDDWECIHWHYPGHGHSKDPPTNTLISPERLADDAASVIRDAGVEHVTAVGHSMGVQVALELWRRHKSLVDGLVLINGSPGKIVEGFHESGILSYFLPLVDMFSRFVPRHMRKLWRALPSDLLLRAVTHSKEVNRRLIKPGDLGEYLSRINSVDLGVGIRTLEGAGRHDATPYLEEIDIPVLVIAGREDTFTPPRRSELMASLISGSELVMVPGGTHSLPIEQPDLVNLTVKRFLKDRIGK